MCLLLLPKFDLFTFNEIWRRAQFLCPNHLVEFSLFNFFRQILVVHWSNGFLRPCELVDCDELMILVLFFCFKFIITSTLPVILLHNVMHANDCGIEWLDVKNYNQSIVHKQSPVFNVIMSMSQEIKLLQSGLKIRE